MGIKISNMIMALFMMLMILGVSSEESASADCTVQCILPCGRGDNPTFCFMGCMEKCGAALPKSDPIDYCELGCVTSTCLKPDTDDKKAEACLDDCSGQCKKAYQQH